MVRETANLSETSASNRHNPNLCARLLL